MFIFRRSNEVRPIWGPLEVCNWHVCLVNLDIEKLFPSLEIL
jgi:hypothetical protein